MHENRGELICGSARLKLEHGFFRNRLFLETPTNPLQANQLVQVKTSGPFLCFVFQFLQWKNWFQNQNIFLWLCCSDSVMSTIFTCFTVCLPRVVAGTARWRTLCPWWRSTASRGHGSSFVWRGSSLPSWLRLTLSARAIPSPSSVIWAACQGKSVQTSLTT